VAECNRLYAEGKKALYNDKKKSLYSHIFMTAYFEPNNGGRVKKPLDSWRLQSAAHLSGLIMHDFDHLSSRGTTAEELYAKIPDWMKDDKSCPFALLYAAHTPSHDGLRLVTMADPARGKIADQQQHIARILGVECDQQCINADRTSFAVRESDILYINDLLFTYENTEYDSKFGHLYRSGDSGSSNRRAESRTKRSSQSPKVAATAAVQAVGAGDQLAGDDHHETAAVQELSYDGVDAQKIIDKWLEKNGTPKPGARHMSLLRLASSIRYICDNDPKLVAKWCRLAPFVRDIERERGAEEVDNACADMCDKGMCTYLPKTIRTLLADAGANVETKKKEPGDDLSWYSTYWERLRPLLTSPYTEACALTEDGNKIGAVFASGAMFCTLMTRCWYEHFDGMPQRMNPNVYIIGMPGAGKSFADRLDSIIMGPMVAADRMGREAEAEYSRKLKERQTSSKEQRGEALKKPELMVRYCLSKTSNAVLFHRMRNAHETIDGEDMHLHLYTFDSELDANTKAQSGGTWIDKHDIELKAFHNERTGVDFSNADSANGLYEVYYNTVCTGTPLSLNRKINIRNVNDGLCSRIAFFQMMPEGYKMIAKGSRARNHELECKLKEWAFRFDSMKGELAIKPLVDHVYSLCEQATWEAEASGDDVLDFLRKRAVFYATWFTIPRIYGRQWDEYQKTGKVVIDQGDLDFATLMFEAVIYWQDRFFGRMLQESWTNVENDYKPRVRNTQNDGVFAKLPAEFTTKQVQEMLGISKGGASAQIGRWLKQGLCERSTRGMYRKKGQVNG
jgi:hypothetical protein